MSKLILKLIWQTLSFWVKRKWSRFTTPKGEPSLDEFYGFVKRSQNIAPNKD